MGVAPVAQAQSVRDDRWLATAIIVAGLVLSVWFGRLSTGTWQWDELCRYLMARWTWDYPQYALYDWAHPGFVAAYFLPARFGWGVSRLASALFSGAAAWWGFRTAQTLGLRSAWAVAILTFAQPMFFTLSLTTLSETIAAFYLAGAVLLALRGYWSASAFVLSIAMTSRSELITLVPVWIVAAYLAKARLIRLWPILAGPLIVNALQWMCGVPMSIAFFMTPHPVSAAPQSGWLTMSVRAVEAWGPAIAGLGLAGLVFVVRRPGGVLVCGTIIVVLLTQTAIRALGTYLSNGFPRQLVSVAPLVAVSAMACWNELTSDDARRRRLALWSLAAAFVFVLIAVERQFHLNDQSLFMSQPAYGRWTVRAAAGVTFVLAVAASLGGAMAAGRLACRAMAVLLIATCAYLFRPLEAQPAQRVADGAWKWLRANGYEGRELVTLHIYFDYVTDKAVGPNRASLTERIAASPVGAIVAWDTQFPGWNQERMSVDELARSPDFRLIHATEPLPNETEPYIRLYERVAVTGTGRR